MKQANCILTLFNKKGEVGETKETFISKEFSKEIVKVLSRKDAVIANLEEMLKKYSFEDLEGNKLEIKAEDIAGINLPLV